MHKQSAGIILYQSVNGHTVVLLVHPGGPFWAKKDTGVWSIPKGEFEQGEEPLTAARREFKEETGSEPLASGLIELGCAKQPSGKLVYAWAASGQIDTQQVKSNDFTMEWPPKSGTMQQFPEVDRAEWFSLPEASLKLVKGQLPLLERLRSALHEPATEDVSSNEP